MEDAKMSGSNDPFYQQGIFPSVVTTDDLVFELGKNVVERINKEKLLNGLLDKSKKSETQVAQAEALMAKAEQLKITTSTDMIKINTSNKLYEENNRRLDAELVKARNIITENNITISSLTQEKNDLIQERDALLKKSPKRKALKVTTKEMD